MIICYTNLRSGPYVLWLTCLNTLPGLSILSLLTDRTCALDQAH